MFQGLRDPRDRRAPVDAPSSDLQVLQEREDRKETLDNKECRDFQAEPELRAEKESQDPEGCRAKTVPRADRVPQEPSGLQEPRGPQVTRALRESRGSWDHRVLLGAKGRKVNGVTSSRQHQFRPSPGRSVSSSSRATWLATTPS